MSYTVLARRYRSNTFDEVVGQTHVAQTLKRAIESGRIAHAYLFCGTRGTGKTSTARILAKCLNCHASDKPTTQPCGTCTSCVAIARGDDIDVIEIDAASNTGVDNIRDLIENSQYIPAKSRFKVYIIDEAHMLSKQAFNALLKTLEEPPGHVKFILATTEPEKLLPTILSRCQRYDFRNIPTRQIAEHLAEICRKEKIDADLDALLLVARAGAGSMRDALSLLDRLLSVGEGKLTAELIGQLLGLPRSRLVYDLAQSIGTGDVKATLAQADAMITSGLSVDTLIASLVEHLRNLLILRTCGADSNLVEVPGVAISDLAAQAAQFDPLVLTQDIAILEELRRLMRQAQAGRALMDATLVRLALAEQFASIGQLLQDESAPPASPRLPVQKKKPEVMALPPAPVDPDAPAADAPSYSTAAMVDTGEPVGDFGSDRDDHDDVDDDDLPAVGRVFEGERVSLAALMSRHQQPAAPPMTPAGSAVPAASSEGSASNIEPVDPSDLPRVWQALLALLAPHGPGLKALLAPAQFVGIQDGMGIIRYARQHQSLIKLVERNGKKDLLRDALTQVIGRPLGVKFDLAPEEAGDRPAAGQAAPPAGAAPAGDSLAESQVAGPPALAVAPAAVAPTTATSVPAGPMPIPLTADLVAQLQNDPLIRAVLNELGGQIVRVTE